jgi:hypothetical protein
MGETEMAQKSKPAQKRGVKARAARTPRRSVWEKSFIAQLGETSNVSAAAQAAGISLSHVYKLRREDEAFARRWFDALAEGYDNLEMELLQHIRAKGGEGEAAAVPKSRFDPAIAFRCLAAHRESVAREKGRRTLAGEVATIAAINAKIDKLRLNGEAATKAIAKVRKERRDAARKGAADAEA